MEEYDKRSQKLVSEVSCVVQYGTTSVSEEAIIYFLLSRFREDIRINVITFQPFDPVNISMQNSGNQGTQLWCYMILNSVGTRGEDELALRQ